MKYTIILFAAVLFFFNFTPTSEPVVVVNEDFRFGSDIDENRVTPTFYNNQPNVVWISDAVKVKERFDAFEEKHGVKALGLTDINANKCTIYAYEPVHINDWKMDVLGHEFYHCARGTFHKKSY